MLAANSFLADSCTRDKLLSTLLKANESSSSIDLLSASKKSSKNAAFEMEAAGLVRAVTSAQRKNLDYMVIRGICDYCDSHATRQWQEYASATAAAFACAVLQDL